LHTTQSTARLFAGSIEQAAEDARRRMEDEIHGLHGVERELDSLGRKLSALRAQLQRRAGDGLDA
jgi:hypothetical protein